MPSDLPELADDVLDRPLAGRNLPATTLRALGERDTLLVFLRHYG